MRFILLVIAAVLSLSSHGQDLEQPSNHLDNTAIIKSFISDLADQDKAVDIVLSQHVIVEEPTDELYDYLEASLQEIRINLMTKKLAEIDYIPYDSMPRREIRDIDPEGLPTDHMYFLHYKKRQMLAVYVEDGKIGSFTLVSKGENIAHFVLY